MKTGTKTSQNPNYGRPSARKLRARIAGWKTWAQSMTMLRQIHSEIQAKLDASNQAYDMLQNSTSHNPVEA